MAESFVRYEKKYLLSKDQYSLIREMIRDFTEYDVYREYELMSVYYDSDDYKLIRRSIEKPLYKEKLRIRAYCPPEDDDEIQVELKKKFEGIVYKRRTTARYGDVLSNIYACKFNDEQIAKELDHFLNYYGKLSPKIYTACKRTNYVGKEDKSLRITFDEDMVYRTKNVSLNKDINDRPISEKVVMEIKVAGAMPLWLSAILDEVKAYPQPFSKVGTAYLKEMEERRWNYSKQYSTEHSLSASLSWPQVQVSY